MTETPERRSRTMRAVRSRDTGPEIAVRRMLRRSGFPGYRVHRKSLPGNPDIVFAGRKKAIFVHGCFWHGHDCRRGAREPKSNRDYWLAKIGRNRRRDADSIAGLGSMGWTVLTIWECEIANPDDLATRIRAFMGGRNGEDAGPRTP